MINIKSKGDFSKLEKYLKKVKAKSDLNKRATEVADICLDELIKATPVDSGLTAKSWGYEVTVENDNTKILFYNKNLQNGINVALLLEFGHGTQSGTWVEGKNYIDPIIRKNYLNIINNSWKEMTKL